MLQHGTLTYLNNREKDNSVSSGRIADCAMLTVIVH